MTTMQADPATRSTTATPAHDPVRARMNKARASIVAVMIVSIILAAVSRDWALRYRTAAIEIPGTAVGSARSSLGSMNSFALALLLGGLRGPLVMFLWSTSESQKADKDLEDFDTKVEWIRLLQPEFDTVHIFQVWNKAYNISVQMANRANKYTTILDAIEYAKNTLASKPNNINLLVSLAQVYGDKLGTQLTEKDYYRARVRKETAPHARKSRLNRDDPAWRPVELDPVLDENGNLLPDLVTPKRTASAPSPIGFNDGSELQYLKKYEPYHYGLSPLAIAFNYYKQAQVLQRVARQKHAQLSELVVDSRPALTLKMWAEDEMERGRKNELLAYGAAVPTERLDMELTTMKLPNTTPDSARVDEALDAYALAAKLTPDAIAEYNSHLKLFPNSQQTYDSHIYGLMALGAMAQADHDFLLAQRTTGEEKAKLLKSAAEQYKATSDENYRMLLRYTVDDIQASRMFPPGVTRATVNSIPAEHLAPLYAHIRAQIPPEADSYAEDRAEYEKYVLRAQTRLAQIEQVSK